MIVYNPKTRPEFPKTYQGPVRCEGPLSDYHFHIPYKSREECIKKDFTGSATWVEDGMVYSCMQHGSWDFKALTNDVEPIIEWGINWATLYFLTKEAAYAYDIGDNQYRSPSYSEVGDVWVMQVHL